MMFWVPIQLTSLERVVLVDTHQIKNIITTLNYSILIVLSFIFNLKS